MAASATMPNTHPATPPTLTPLPPNGARLSCRQNAKVTDTSESRAANPPDLLPKSHADERFDIETPEGSPSADRCILDRPDERLLARSSE
jgi:hypothetical protein